MKVFTVITVKKDSKEVTYEVPGTGQEVVKNFRNGLPKGSSSILRGFFIGEERKFIPVDLNSN